MAELWGERLNIKINALKADGYRLIMFGQDDFEKMTSQKYGYLKGTNSTLELVYEVENFAAVDHEYKWLVNQGSVLLMLPITEPWGQRTCYVADPDGILIEIGTFNNGG